MKIGILECGHIDPKIAATIGTYPEIYAQLLQGHDFNFANFDVVNMQFPANVQECDGWLLTGSKHGAYDDLPFIKRLQRFIRDAYDEAIPLVGICFGHQIVAQAMGGTVEKFAGGWALGLNDYSFDDLGPQQLNAWHQDQVVRRPDMARLIATSPFCENAALAYGTRALTIQPHPEFEGDAVQALADLRRGTGDYPNDLLDQALANKDKPNTNLDVSQFIAQFFKTNRKPAA